MNEWDEVPFLQGDMVVSLCEVVSGLAERSIRIPRRHKASPGRMKLPEDGVSAEYE